MTLATYIAILQPVPVEPLYEMLDALVNDRGVPSEVTRKPGSISNKLGQGNRSMLDIDYAIDGPLDTREQARAEHEKWSEPGDSPFDPWTSSYHVPLPHLVKIGLDTTYGFKDPSIGGRGGCADLHAGIIRAVGMFLEARNIDVSEALLWRNEFTGEWHRGLDGLAEFTDSGDEAGDWFVGTVRPLLGI